MAGINYSEERAYWYLRLNGFFPLTNFVIHKSTEITYRRDVDLIGIRMPYVYEEIGGRPDDFDKRILNLCGYDFNIQTLNKPIIAICEIKSNLIRRKINLDMADLESKNTIDCALKRVGILPLNKIDTSINRLSESAYVEEDEALIIKILFSNQKTQTCNKYINFNLNGIRKFIYKHILKYIDEKYASRMFFGSGQFQDYIDLMNAMLKTKSKEDLINIINSM